MGFEPETRKVRTTRREAGFASAGRSDERDDGEGIARVLVSCQGLSKSFGARPLFETLSFGLFEGERTGLIGPNGAGKSTLLRILAGRESPESGAVSARRGLAVGYLPQKDVLALGETGTVREAGAAALGGLGLEDYEVDLRVEAGLERAGFSDPDQPVAGLSGGWRKRLAILGQVLREPDLLLLDEPTNHLDVEGVLWLERFLSGLSFSFLVVTHDRRFLERVSNRVVELNKRYPEGHFSSAGNYSRFLERREELFAAQEATESALRNTVRGEIEWLRRGPKARTTKQQARIDRAGGLLEDLADLEHRNGAGRATEIDFSGSERQTNRLVELAQVEKSLGGRRLFQGLDLMLRPGDKLGLLGENGSGKSTLLKLLSGELAPDAGRVKRAERLQVVAFDQDREQLDLDQSLTRALCPAGEHVAYKGARIHVYGWASRFLFRQEQMEMPLRLLSGGEQARVLIARLLLRPADVRLLDEPTNDLDIQSLEVLEASMRDFPGALVLVTHDRYLLDRVSREVLALDGRGGARFFADLSQWEDAQAREGGSAPPAKRAAPSVTPALSAKEARELKGMEAAIQSAEAAVAKARAGLEDPAVASDAAELSLRHEALDAARRRLDALYSRWSDLDSKA
ncbi:MAG: ABC-F family ATP-binding cassette domain-containing protein [Elusimicrobia bacterium]|nr:ABC-F family ATP-binding cassette domain-containing protein [Elusimicrobiota bacterium]